MPQKWEGMRIEPDSLPINEARDRATIASTDRGAELQDTLLPDPLEMREGGDVRVQLIEMGKLVLAGMDQDRHAMAERNVGEFGWRSFEKGTAGERQRPDQRVP